MRKKRGENQKELRKSIMRHNPQTGRPSCAKLDLNWKTVRKKHHKIKGRLSRVKPGNTINEKTLKEYNKEINQESPAPYIIIETEIKEETFAAEKSAFE